MVKTIGWWVGGLIEIIAASAKLSLAKVCIVSKISRRKLHIYNCEIGQKTGFNVIFTFAALQLQANLNSAKS